MSPQVKVEETYYDILKVDPKSTVTEIVAAYHSAKNAFSRDSVATYSLFSTQEIQGILDRLDEAFQHLSNVDKKREYDRRLRERSEAESVPEMSERDRLQNAQGGPKDASAQTPPPTHETPVPATPVDMSVYRSEDCTGPLLKEIREKRSLSQEDVCRITKIPLKFIQAIERDAFPNPNLPARVYLQGFVKNLANLYRLDAKVASKAYLDYVAQKGMEPKTA